MKKIASQLIVPLLCGKIAYAETVLVAGFTRAYERKGIPYSP